MKKSLFLLSIFLWAFSRTAIATDDPERVNTAMINFTAGQVGIADDINGARRHGVEVRLRSFSRWELIPAFGFTRADNGANFLYADLRHDFWLSDNWLVIPSFGLGSFKDSDEINLGNDLEFRTGIELAYKFYRQYRIGLALFHLSNGGLSDRNPGTEALVVSLSIPWEL